MSLASVKMELNDFGFNNSLLEEFVARFGTEILALIREALRVGLSKDLVIEILNRLGPLFLDLAVKLLSRKNPSELSTKDQVNEAAVSVLLAGVLPGLIEKFGPILAELLIEFLLRKSR